MTQPHDDPFAKYSQEPGTGQSHPAGGSDYSSYQAYQGQNEGLTPEKGPGGLRRWAAYIIDSFIVSIIAILVFLIFFGSDGLDKVTELGSTEGNSLYLISGVLMFAYFTFMQTTDFSTIGKRVLGIRVTTLDHQPISLTTSALRSAWLLLQAIPGVGTTLLFFVGLAIFIMAFTGDRTQGLDDKWAKTRVVRR